MTDSEMTNSEALLFVVAFGIGVLLPLFIVVAVLMVT
jgi:hypothetical protein